jgi:TolB-like protein
MHIWSTEIKELETLYTSLKGRFPELEKELERLIKADDENMVLLYSRRCLEVIITNLCESELERPRKTEPLKGIIDKLNREEKVPANIIASMQSLNSLSTFGAHPKDFDPEQVRPVLINLTTIIKWYLKYKDTQIISRPKTKEVRDEIKTPDISSEQMRQPKKRLILLLSGLALVVIVIVALFLFNIIGGGKKTEELEKSIAVLPFHNYSGDPGQEYMSDGLTDEIINHLYKIASFDKVVSLNSVLTYKGTNKRLPEIADELKVNYILEGTYKKIGEQVRVTAQLIEPKNDKHLWQNEYDKPYQEIIAIQSDIALQIADHVKAFLTSSEIQNIQKIPTSSQEAYELLQQALYSSSAITSFSTLWSQQNVDLILKAIELDPDYADAYAVKGNLILGSANYGGGHEMQSAGWDAMQYFEKALEIDPDNGYAHFGLGQLNDWFIWDYIKAEKEFLKGMELLPNYSSIPSQFGEFLMKMNRLEDAGSCFNGLESYFQIQYREIRRKILAGNHGEAHASIREFLELWKEEGYIWAGEAFIWLGNYDSALFYLTSVKPSDDPEILIPRFQACLALAYHKKNHYSESRNIINQLIAGSDTTSAMSPEFFTGWYYSGIGKADSAFLWLEKAYKNRSPEMPWLKVDPILQGLKNDDRYRDLYERTGHKAYDEYMSGTK